MAWINRSSHSWCSFSLCECPQVFGLRVRMSFGKDRFRYLTSLGYNWLVSNSLNHIETTCIHTEENDSTHVRVTWLSKHPFNPKKITCFDVRRTSFLFIYICLLNSHHILIILETKIKFLVEPFFQNSNM